MPLELHAGDAAHVSGAEFTEAMSTLASGVAVVTCLLDGRPWGMTVTSFSSVSAEPPTVLVAIRSTAGAAAAITASGRFGVSILSEEQARVAAHCSEPGAAKFLEAFVDAGAGHRAAPAIDGALAHLDCVVCDAARVADHIVFFGRVDAARTERVGPPLVYHRRRYTALAASNPTRERSPRCLAS
jgi:flavin reductase (DIM6/NTAB) family NADH-FMN oxidoreductase RutF